MTISLAHASEKKSIFSHWMWVIAFLLTAAALTLYQADSFPPTVDEFASLIGAGLLDEGHTPAEIVESLLQHSPSHMPGYYFLLSVWGNLTAQSIALARILGILLYALILAQVYRLGKGLIAPVAGLFALVIVMSNAFFNFYIPHARPYTLFLLLSCVAVWHYLRVITRRPHPADYAALGIAVFALVMTHLYSATLLFALGLYHLLFAPKNRRWLWVGLVITIAVLLCLPMVAHVLSGYSTALRHLGSQALSGVEAITLWLNIMLNSQPALFLALAAAGLFVGIRRGMLQGTPILILLALFLVAFALASDVASLARSYTIRHQLDGWILLVLVAAAGHYHLYRWKPLLGALIVLWIIAGISFQRSTNWWHHINIQSLVFTQPPIQALSRLAVESEPKPNIVGYPYDEFFSFTLNYKGYEGGFRAISQSDHYFSQYEMEINATDEKEEFAQFVGRMALHSPSIWHIHENSASSAELAAASEILRSFNYRLCGETPVGLNTIVNQYMWDLLDCQPPLSPGIHQTELIEYEFYRAGLNRDATAAVFIGKWTPRRDFDSQDYNMSYQLISEDWRNVAQLDLSLLAEGELRQYAIDVSQVPPGTYRLMLILYSASTGDRLAWDGNSGYVPEMLPLGEITIGGA